MKTNKYRVCILFAASILTQSYAGDDANGSASMVWKHLSSVNGDIEPPNGGNQQTSSAVFDVDKDGVTDFLITERTASPSVVWYRRGKTGWTKYIVEGNPLHIEAGSAVCDIDSDGDLDILGKPYTWEAPRLDIWINEGIKTGKTAGK